MKKKLIADADSLLVLVAAASAIGIGSSAEARRFCGFFHCLDAWKSVHCSEGNVDVNSCDARVRARPAAFASAIPRSDG